MRVLLMIAFISLILSIYSALGVSYLLGRRVYTWYHKRRYIKWLTHEQSLKAPSLTSESEVETVEQSSVSLPYEREIVERETVEEREWRVEQAFLKKKSESVEAI